MTSITKALYAFDAAQHDGTAVLCGVDEAGRGPLCGPVSVGAVILDPANPIDGINDSKKISEKKREALYEEIVNTAIAWHVALVPPEEIDRLNIHWATMLGMEQAVAGLSVQPNLVLVDGSHSPNVPAECRTFAKGDGKSASIAAASILAKVTRDRVMRALDTEFPEYKLAQHKGYPTKLHYELLEQHGVLPFYRQSYLKKFYAKRGAV